MFDNGPVPGRNDACWCGSGKAYADWGRWENFVNVRISAGTDKVEIIRSLQSRARIPNHQMSVRIQENGISRIEEKRKPSVCHVRLRQSILACDCRAKALQNVTRGKSALLAEK